MYSITKNQTKNERTKELKTQWLADQQLASYTGWYTT